MADAAAKSTISIEEVASLLEMSRKSVLRAIDVGDLPQPIRVGSKKFWLRCDFFTWLRNQPESRADQERTEAVVVGIRPSIKAGPKRSRKVIHKL